MHTQTNPDPVYRQEFLDTLHREDVSDREIYNHLIDYLYEHRCFHNGISGQPCMFESYMTVLDFEKISRAMEGFTVAELERIVSVILPKDRVPMLNSFTPLAPVLGTFLESRIRRMTMAEPA